jgi:hypothetical protein
MLNEQGNAKVWELENKQTSSASEIGQAVRNGKNWIQIPVVHDFLALQRWQIYPNIAPYFC